MYIISENKRLWYGSGQLEDSKDLLRQADAIELIASRQVNKIVISDRLMSKSLTSLVKSTIALSDVCNDVSIASFSDMKRTKISGDRYLRGCTLGLWKTICSSKMVDSRKHPAMSAVKFMAWCGSSARELISVLRAIGDIRPLVAATKWSAMPTWCIVDQLLDTPKFNNPDSKYADDAYWQKILLGRMSPEESPLFRHVVASTGCPDEFILQSKRAALWLLISWWLGQEYHPELFCVTSQAVSPVETFFYIALSSWLKDAETASGDKSF